MRPRAEALEVPFEGGLQGELEGLFEGRFQGRFAGLLEGRLQGELEVLLEGQLPGRFEGSLEERVQEPLEELLEGALVVHRLMGQERSVSRVSRRSKGRREASRPARASHGPHPSTSRLLTLGPISAPLRFTRCDDVIDGLRSVLRGWDPSVHPDVARVARGHHARRSSAKARKVPLIRVTRTREGYRRVSAWTRVPSDVRERTRGSVTSAVCGVHFELIDWYAAEHPRQLCLHAAGSLFPRGLVVFPALAKAGKSVLTVALAERGVRIYADDVVPIDLTTRRAVALGILPRLRPPLPTNLTRRLRDYVDAHRGLGRGDRLYVEVPDAQMVPYGATTPVRGIVLLERRATGAASIEHIDAADALETLILQNFAHAPPADRVLDTLHRVVAGAECRRLRYARSEDAASVLLATFGDPATTRARVRTAERRP